MSNFETGKFIFVIYVKQGPFYKDPLLVFLVLYRVPVIICLILYILKLCFFQWNTIRFSISKQNIKKLLNCYKYSVHLRYFYYGYTVYGKTFISNLESMKMKQQIQETNTIERINLPQATTNQSGKWPRNGRRTKRRTRRTPRTANTVAGTRPPKQTPRPSPQH